MQTQNFEFELREAESALGALARETGLPKARLKDAMLKGALWLRRGGKSRRLRRSTAQLRPGDGLQLYYNPELLALQPPEPALVADEKRYSVWDKPPGLLSQGTREGDHCSLLRIAEQKLKRDCFLVHRLDREAGGLMLIAHDGPAAAALSALFARRAGERPVDKGYRIEVRGELPERGEFDAPLDGKEALTRFVRRGYDAAADSSVAEVQLITGRKHQIRRHFAAAGHPVLGDPQYGRGKRDPRGLQLRAVKLSFTCPFSKQSREYSLPPSGGFSPSS